MKKAAWKKSLSRRQSLSSSVTLPLALFGWKKLQVRLISCASIIFEISLMLMRRLSSLNAKGIKYHRRSRNGRKKKCPLQSQKRPLRKGDTSAGTGLQLGSFATGGRFMCIRFAAVIPPLCALSGEPENLKAGGIITKLG